VASRVRFIALLLVLSVVVGSAGPVLAAPPPQTDSAPLLAAARTDLESLANMLLGDGVRPPGWTNSLDVNAPSFMLDLRLDLETLAGTLLGADQRPVGWFGAVPGTPWSIARDIRHDLELLADRHLGPGNRPELWIGGDPLMRCDRAVQAMVMWLQRTNPAFVLSQFDPGADYCQMVSQQANLFVEILVTGQPPAGDLRADLNALDTVLFREGVFPEGWTGGNDAESIRQDLETLRLATAQVGTPIDAVNWFGTTIGAEWVVARAARHDLEVLADARLGFGQRPAGWTYSIGAEPIRCPRSVQNLVALLQQDAGFVSSANPADPGFCQALTLQASGFAENTQVNPGTGGGGVVETMAVSAENATGAVVVGQPGSVSGQATTPYAYLDHSARLRIGQIPRGTPFTALARSSAPDSRMMLVQGEGFTVWIAWPWTTLTEQQYLSLPFAEDVEDQLPQLLCFAAFCSAIVHNGDPLGGPIDMEGALLSGGAGYSGVPTPGSNLQYLDYSHTRLLFNLDNVDEGWAELRMELCTNPSDFNTCEPVVRLYENGQVVPPVRVENGYPVWRLTYFLHETARLESQHFYVNQLWVTHPYDR